MRIVFNGESQRTNISVAGAVRLAAAICRTSQLFILLFAIAPGLFAETVPGRYIVELSTDSVAEHMGHNLGRDVAAASTHRARVRAEQQEVSRRIAAQGAVLDSVDTIANALVVQIPDAQAAQLASIPGVRRVHAVRLFHMSLDRAVIVDKVTEAWNQVGVDRAGAGVKIAIIDTGIDANHRGFQDSSLALPASFPRVNSASDQAYTNNKVIVARSYVSMLPNRDPDLSARDRVGHGTALAMVAAGVRNSGPLATITGAAPKAYLGSYKVFGTPGVNDSASEDAILKAMDDAVADGMDIINLSLGSDLAPRLADDIGVQAIERASAAGVIVVVAAGNNGPDLNTISSPATAPSAIAVGAHHNDRTFAATAEIAGIAPMIARLGDGAAPSSAVTGTVADAALACSSLPPGSASGRIALILRGTCTFATKLNNAQQAGAIGALVYAAPDAPDPISMAVGGATLPAEMVGYSDGAAVKQLVAADPSLTLTLRFTLTAVSVDALRLTDFSAAGPNVDSGIKPDLVAVGADMYVATQTLDPNGDMYDPSGYISVDGTSFSTPLVAGTAALLKSARPGLSVDQYRSLLINSAGAIHASVQEAGGGILDAGAALRGVATALPTALSFGAGGPDPQLQRTLTISNVGPAAETYSIFVQSDDPSSPAVATNTIQIAPGASVDVPVSWQATGLAAGAHEGAIRVVANGAGTEMKIPYWYAVTSGVPAAISVLDSIDSARRGSLARDAVLFRITDSAGLPLTNLDPQVTAISGGGSVQTIVSHDSDVPGLFGINVRLGPAAGSETFHIQAGDAGVDVSIVAQ